MRNLEPNIQRLLDNYDINILNKKKTIWMKYFKGMCTSEWDQFEKIVFRLKKTHMK